MEENSVFRVSANVQKQSKIHDGKFKESFCELFADALKSCRETGCLENQKENLLAALEEASFVEFKVGLFLEKTIFWESFSTKRLGLGPHGGGEKLFYRLP